MHRSRLCSEIIVSSLLKLRRLAKSVNALLVPQLSWLTIESRIRSRERKRNTIVIERFTGRQISAQLSGCFSNSDWASVPNYSLILYEGIRTKVKLFHTLSWRAPQEEGVTWDLLREDELGVGAEESLQVSKEDDEGNESVPSADERTENTLVSGDSTDGMSAVRHKALFVEEVMDNPRIRFFGLTRPGSYIAVSFEFSDVASAASVVALCKWMQQKQQREEAIAVAQEHSEAAKPPARETNTTDFGLAIYQQLTCRFAQTQTDPPLHLDRYGASRVARQFASRRGVGWRSVRVFGWCRRR